MPTMLSSDEAARRLGVKVSTLYVYVSRGMLASHRDGTSRRSYFVVEEVEALAERSRGGKRVETRVATIATAVSQLTDAGPLYRGVPAVSLVDTAFERVAEDLWRTDPVGWTPIDCPRIDLGALLPHATGHDRLRLLVSMVAGADPIRSDRRPERVAQGAATLLATASRLLAPESVSARRDDGREESPSIAGALAGSDEGAAEAVNALLVLLADHELATSTLAVRLAASTHADASDALLAGLGVLGGPLHGSHSVLTFRLLEEIERRGAAQVVEDHLRWDRHVPGFGIGVYPSVDPRFVALRPFIDRLTDERSTTELDALVDICASHGCGPPNIDLGLAALVRALGWPADAGPTLFAIARVAGWVAHYLEELDEPPLRFRARAIYVEQPP